jgi:uncharacterized membrane protein HdeD (DUF308 family)
MYSETVPTQQETKTMSDQSLTPAGMSEAVRAKWGWFLFAGIVFLVAGSFAFLAPFFASVVVTVVVAVGLIIAGVVQIFQAWSVQSWAGFLWQLVIGLVLLIGGIAIYFNPVEYTYLLTIFAAALFIAKGVVQIILGFRIKPNDAWGWIVAAGVVAILVGIMIWIELPVSATFALGVLAGISLIFTGWSYVAIALAAKRSDAT